MLSSLVAIAIVGLQGGSSAKSTSFPLQRVGYVFQRHETFRNGGCQSSWLIRYGDGFVEPIDLASSVRIEPTAKRDGDGFYAFVDGERKRGRFVAERINPILEPLLNDPRLSATLRQELPRDAFKKVEQDIEAPITAQEGPTPENRKYLLLCVRFSDTKSAVPPHDMPWYTKVMRKTFPGVDHFYRESSYGKVSVSGNQVIGWLDLPGKQADYKSGGSWDVQKFINDAVPLVDSQVNFKTIWGIDVFPNVDDNSGFSYATSARIKSKETNWDRPVTSLNPWTDEIVVVHENGHNFGFDHTSVGNDVYLNNWSPMGNGGRYWPNTFEDLGLIANDHNGYHKSLVGWLTPTEVLSVYPGQTRKVRLERIDRPSKEGYKLARVYAPGLGRYFSVEARKFVGKDAKTWGYDNQKSLDGGEAAIIYYVDDDQAWNPGASRLQSNPNRGASDTDYGSGAIFHVGQSFTNADNSITITVDSADVTGFNFTIKSKAGTMPGVVVNTADSGPGSLREAIHYANLNPGAKVTFKIPKSDPGYANGVFTIKPSSGLSYFTSNDITIDGTSQTAATGDSNPNGPEVFIDGSGAGNSIGLVFYQGTNQTIKGIGVTNFAYTGIYYYYTDGGKVLGCVSGMNPAGNDSAHNGWDGITVDHCTNMTIGGPAKADRNIISGNNQNGDAISVDGAVGASFVNNWIGVSYDGKKAIPNKGAGIYIHDGSSAITASGNYICGNPNGGITVWDPTTHDIKLTGNFIGLLPDNKTVAGNGGPGVLLNGAYSNEVSGSTIVGNGSGVRVGGVSNKNLVTNNLIGCTATSQTGTANNGSGVDLVEGAYSNTVSLNVSSGNKGVGIYLSGVGTPSGLKATYSNIVSQNIVGLDPSGKTAWKNASRGIVIAAGASLNRIEANTISGNTLEALVLNGVGTAKNVVISNRIGLATTGSDVVPNGSHGIKLETSTSDNTFQKNMVSGNGGDGVYVQGGAVNNKFLGNTIGGIGSSALGNGRGMVFDGSGANLVGGTAANANVIAGNRDQGVLITGTSTGVTVRLNQISGNGRLGIDLAKNDGEGGVTANDNLDSDTGPNDLVNFPTVTVTGSGASLKAVVTLSAKANTDYTVDLYGVGVADPTGYGEGDTFLGTYAVKTDSTGKATVTKTVGATGSYSTVCATATETATGSTSEFGPIPTGAPIPRLTAPAVTGTAGGSVSLSATLTDRFTGKGIADAKLVFTLAGKSIGSPKTTSTGTAKFSYTIPAATAKGTYNILIKYAGDDTHAAVNVTTTLTVQ